MIDLVNELKLEGGRRHYCRTPSLAKEAAQRCKVVKVPTEERSFSFAWSIKAEDPVEIYLLDALQYCLSDKAGSLMQKIAESFEPAGLVSVKQTIHDGSGPIRIFCLDIAIKECSPENFKELTSAVIDRFLEGFAFLQREGVPTQDLAEFLNLEEYNLSFSHYNSERAQRLLEVLFERRHFRSDSKAYIFGNDLHQELKRRLSQDPDYTREFIRKNFRLPDDIQVGEAAKLNNFGIVICIPDEDLAMRHLIKEAIWISKSFGVNPKKALSLPKVRSEASDWWKKPIYIPEQLRETNRSFWGVEKSRLQNDSRNGCNIIFEESGSLPVQEFRLSFATNHLTEEEKTILSIIASIGLDLGTKQRPNDLFVRNLAAKTGGLEFSNDCLQFDGRHFDPLATRSYFSIIGSARKTDLPFLCDLCNDYLDRPNFENLPVLAARLENRLINRLDLLSEQTGPLIHAILRANSGFSPSAASTDQVDGLGEISVLKKLIDLAKTKPAKLLEEITTVWDKAFADSRPEVGILGQNSSIDDVSRILLKRFQSSQNSRDEIKASKFIPQRVFELYPINNPASAYVSSICMPDLPAGLIPALPILEHILELRREASINKKGSVPTAYCGFWAALSGAPSILHARYNETNPISTFRLVQRLAGMLSRSKISRAEVDQARNKLYANVSSFTKDPYFRHAMHLTWYFEGNTFERRKEYWDRVASIKAADFGLLGEFMQKKSIVSTVILGPEVVLKDFRKSTGNQAALKNSLGF